MVSPLFFAQSCYPEIADANFKGTLSTCKQHLALKMRVLCGIFIGLLQTSLYCTFRIVFFHTPNKKKHVSFKFENFIDFYRPQRSWGKVIFSQASVILLTGGCYSNIHCRWYPSMPCSRSHRGGACSGGVPAPGRCGLLLWPSVMVFCYALLLWPSVLVAFWLKVAFYQKAITEGVPGKPLRPGTATAEGSTHPTGMHSCVIVVWIRPASNSKCSESDTNGATLSYNHSNPSNRP